jgi:rhamnopyranosyl-N-acetylglucosaminyl-diphospho-decaprenol beta-1,3/1,4-galactofuranosyltransferase
LSAQPRVAAVVVSFNRIKTLTQVLDGLHSQSRAVDKIIVVDNGSTDGSRDFVARRGGVVSLISAAKNEGGAGGFSKGIAWAMELGFDYVWLMDDDAVPYGNALELLLEPFDLNFSEPVAFTCPRVNDATGNVGPRNFPLLSHEFNHVYPAVEQGLLPVKAATFVGPLISLAIARKTHLPLEDFFIWHDDIEYTSRLTQHGLAFSVPRAQIAHFVTNPGPKSYNAGRNFYNIRNLLWWIKEARISNSYEAAVLARQLRGSVRTQFIAAPNKLSFVIILTRALWAAISTSPKHRHAPDVVRESRAVDGLTAIAAGSARPQLE